MRQCLTEIHINITGRLNVTALILSTFFLLVVSTVFGFLCLGIKITRNKAKVDLDTIDRSSGGFLVTHGMVRDKTSGRLKPDSEYSELFYRSLAD
jgi:hypothetical protein